MSSISWCPLTGRELPEVAALATRVLAADGGLPMAADESFLARRYAGAGVRGCAARDGAGRLVAAGAVRPGPVASVATGMVDPGARGRGLGAALLDWALLDWALAPAGADSPRSGGVAGTTAVGDTSAAAGAVGPVVVETESLTEAAAALFGTRGLRQVFAEDVMRFDLADLADLPALPAGIWLEAWSAANARRFFDVYVAAFVERPNFPGWSAAEWSAWLADDDEFRPQCSVLAVDAERGDVGFVACAAGWIVQVGVRPDQRGRGLGAGLMVEALRRLRGAGERQALLDVNVDNPAGDLYRRLGFQMIGRRARFAAP